MWLNKRIAKHLRSSEVKRLFFLKRNFNFPFILVIPFIFIGSPDTRYVTCACYFMFISLYLILSLRIFLALHLLTKRIDLVLSSP